MYTYIFYSYQGNKYHTEGVNEDNFYPSTYNLFLKFTRKFNLRHLSAGTQIPLEFLK